MVKTLDAALRLAKTTGWSRLVTVDGELVHSSGAVTGGYQTKASYGIVQRKADLAELKRDLAKMASQISGFEKRSAGRRQELENLQAQREQAIVQRQSFNSEVGEAESYFRALAEELKATLREKEKLEKELAPAEGSPALAPINIAEIESARDDALKALAAKSADADSSQQRLRDAEARMSQARIRTENTTQRLKQAQIASDSRNLRAESIGPEREADRRANREAS